MSRNRLSQLKKLGVTLAAANSMHIYVIKSNVVLLYHGTPQSQYHTLKTAMGAMVA